MTNHSRGHDAEQHAAAWLKKQGYKLVEINWRRTRAEIDIIARKKRGPVTFIEVKYRESANQGSGLDYITPHKLQQMQFAAELWVSENRYNGECVLAGLEISGPDFNVTNFIPEI